MVNKIVDWLNRPVTFSILIKFIICLNVTILMLCYGIAKLGDIRDKEEQEYVQYLEYRVKTQSELIELYQKQK